MNLTVPIRETALACPRLPALTEGSGSWTFGELWSAACRTRRFLAERNLRPGDRVLLWLPDGAAFLAAHLGVVASGFVSVALKADNGPFEIDSVIADTRPSLMITDSRLLGRLDGDRPAGVEIVESSHLPLRGDGLDMVPRQVPPDTPALILYTYFLGRGRAYGAVLSHQNQSFAAIHCGRFHKIERGDRVVLPLPMPHVFSLGVAILPSLYRGACLHVCHTFRPRTLLSLLSDRRVTHLIGVPQMFEPLRWFFDPAKYDLSSIKHLITGGDYLPENLQEEIQETLGVPFVQGWGLTEAMPATCNPPDKRNRHGTLGITDTPEIQYGIWDSQGRRLAPGKIGEIRVRSPGVMLGYWGAEEATREVLSDGWMRSGDLGWIDEEGYLHFDRLLKPIINIYGNKIDPIEVSGVIREREEVESAEVVAESKVEKSGLTDVSLKARVTLRSGAEADAALIRAHCRRRMASYKVPRHVEFL